jgi:hypothetical protein
LFSGLEPFNVRLFLTKMLFFSVLSGNLHSHFES